MRRKPLLIAIFLVAGRFGGWFPAAPGSAPALQPTMHPLAIVRLNDFTFSEKLAKTGIARALGLAVADYAPGLPGFGGLPPLGSLLSALRESGARDFWCCLLPDGGSWFGMVSLVGGDWPDREGGGDDAGGAFAEWLAARSSDFGGMAADVSRPEPGVIRRIFARDEAILRQALASQAADRPGDGAWRESLADFCSMESAGLAVWLDFRPLLGLVSLSAGMDLRGGLARLGLRIPDSLEIELLPGDGELGMRIRLNRLLPERPSPPPEADSLHLQLREPGKSRLRLADAAALLRAFQLDDNPLFPANLDLRVLFPRSLDLAGWRDGEGGFHWFLVGRVGERAAFIRHYRRFLAWLDLLAASPESGFVLSGGDVSDVGTPRCLTINGFPLVVGFGMAGTENDPSGLFFLAAGSREDYPDLGRLTFTAGPAEKALTWELFLDERSRREIAVGLVALARKNAWQSLEAEVVGQWLAAGDAGSLALSGVSPEVRWRSGIAVLSAAVMALLPVYPAADPGSGE
ncbi:MAG: hypothetical protein LBU23_06530 [Planctomycetota bacterium]|nr:hypothetical protein [Planctomycetota bacterium]